MKFPDCRDEHAHEWQWFLWGDHKIASRLEVCVRCGLVSIELEGDRGHAIISPTALVPA